MTASKDASAIEPLRSGEARPSSGHRAILVDEESELAPLLGSQLERDGDPT